ncbi:3-oxoacyl-ACP synthase [Maribacter algicola]|uniref:3-oxoacyl-ACP synthase n=1 Tax=Meishania litoralis TaxID=3434685 RepID=A0ACC7LI19_9FLAO
MTESVSKKQLLRFCEDYIQTRIFRILGQIDGFRQALTSETKSSAGDKHETGRAMLQLERGKLGRQLAEAEATKVTLSKVDINARFDKVALGSLVKTTKASYFLSISAGEFKSGQTLVYCISISTPIGKLLLGSSVGEIFSFKEEDFTILEIS